MNAITCFNIPLGTIPKAVKVYEHAFKYAERHRDVLSLEVRKQVALGQVTQWARQQDDTVDLVRVANIVRQAGDLVSSRYCIEDRIG